MSHDSGMPPKQTHTGRSTTRDAALIFFIAVLTGMTLFGLTEMTARMLFRESSTKAIDCMIVDDPSTGVRAVPNSVCVEKLAEGPRPVEYRFNRCGHRMDTDCGAKSSGHFRIVLVGSSFVMGLETPVDATFAAKLPITLTQPHGPSVDVYNEGMENGFPASMPLKFGEILAAKPDLILWVLTPFDIKNSSTVLPGRDVNTQGFIARNWARIRLALATKPLPDALADIGQRGVDAFGATKTALMLRHILYQSQSQYVTSYLAGGDDEAGFLNARASPAWQDRLRTFDRYAARFIQQAREAKLPILTVLLPNRAQAAMISMGHWPDGYDPYALGSAVGAMVTRHGGDYVDVLHDYREIPDPQRGYFAVDGHPNERGHAVIAGILAGRLSERVIGSIRTGAGS